MWALLLFIQLIQLLGERLQADRDLRKSFEKVETCLLEFWNNAKLCKGRYSEN